MSSLSDPSSLISPGALETAVHDLLSRVKSVQDAFITSGTNLHVVKCTAMTIQDLDKARQSFLDFYLEAQKTAIEAGAGISSFASVVKIYLSKTTPVQALEAVESLAKDFGSKQKPRYDFSPVVTHLDKVRATTNIMIKKLAAADKQALDAAISRMTLAEEAGEKLREEFKAVVPDILRKFGVSDHSPSLTLYVMLAPYLFLESVVTKWVGGGDEETGNDAKPTAGNMSTKKVGDGDEEDTSINKGTHRDEEVTNGEDQDTKKDKKAGKNTTLGKGKLNKTIQQAGKSNVTIKKVLDIQKRMDANRSEVEDAKVALDRLKEDQSRDDQQAKLMNVLIDIKSIQSDIADISPKVKILGTVYESMHKDLVEVGDLLKAGNTEEASASLKAADKVYAELEPALFEFSTA